MTTPLVHIRNAKSFGPAAAQRLVELHQRQMLVAHGVAQADLGVEIAPLGVQHVDVIGASGTVLQVRQFDVFARRIAQVQLQGRRFAGAAIGDHGVVGLLEDRQDFLLVGQTRFVVGRQRGAGLGGGHDEREQTLNQLLVEMDGFAANQGVVVLAATNRVDILDPALLRPGRFDRQVYVGLPDIKGRQEILAVHAKNKPLAEDVDLEKLAKGTSGFTGADLENLLNEAALLAGRRDEKAITMADLQQSVIKVIAGPEKHSRVIPEHERRLTAYHEAGHAVVMHTLPDLDPVHQITIVPRGQAGGMTIFLPDEDRSYLSRTHLLNSIAGLLGGRAAEQLVLGDISTGASNDISRATQLARKMVGTYGMSDRMGSVAFDAGHDEVFIGRSMAQTRPYSEETAAEMDREIRRILDEAYGRCTEILEKYRPQLTEVAEFLLQHETMTAQEFEQIFASEDKK